MHGSSDAESALAGTLTHLGHASAERPAHSHDGTGRGKPWPASYLFRRGKARCMRAGEILSVL